MDKTTERDIQVIQNLLSQVGSISKKYEELAKVTGENFNVFRVLKIHSDEVRMHSALLGELLNPKGSHGQKDVFLKLFIAQYNQVENANLRINNFNTQNAKVEVEKYIGETIETETEAKGGRIDILITDDKGKKIIIENKINAGDQKYQLVRYHCHDKNANLCYLSLDGRNPSSNSIIYKRGPKSEEIVIDLTDKFVSLSYKSDIKKWLEACLKESVKHAVLRETVSQYINLIKHLTNQSTNQVMEQEIIELILKDKQTIDSAIMLAESEDLLKLAVIAKLAKSLTGAGYTIETYPKEKPLGYPQTGIKFIKNSTDKLCIAIEFENFKLMDIGVCKNGQGEVSSETIEKVFQKLSRLFDAPKKSNDWPWYESYSATWDNYSWGAVADGEFKDKLFEDVRKIEDILGDLLR